MAEKKVSWIGTAFVELTDSDKENLAGMDERALGDAVSLLLAESANGYVLSVKYDPSRSQYSASLYGSHPDCPNAGYSLYGNSTDPVRAMASLYYKHFVIAERKSWRPFATTTKQQALFS